MIVDDEKLVRDTIKLQLRDTGFEIVEAEDGEKAIELLEKAPALKVDAIICDVRMPKVDGIEATTHFRKNYPSIPIIVLTGFPDVKLAVDFIAKGVFDYLVKPVEKEKLISAVTRAVNQCSLFN